MKCERRKPCGNCPFRKQATLAHWHPNEYIMLKDMQRKEGDFEPGRGVFGCHKDSEKKPADREMCIGWLIHQRDEGVPSIALRIRLSSDNAALMQFEACEPDGEQFTDIDELVRVNIRRDMQLNPDRYEDDECLP